jgi:hypothetical protein
VSAARIRHLLSLLYFYDPFFSGRVFFDRIKEGECRDDTIVGSALSNTFEEDVVGV